jgi:hypothetical protein
LLTFTIWPLLHHDLAALVLQRRLGVGDGILRVEHREVGQLHRTVVALDVRLDLDEGHIVEDHLVLLHRPLVEHLGRDVLGRDVDALGAGLVQHVGEQPHLELEAEDVHLGDVLLAAFQDDLFDEQPRHRQVDRPDRHQPPGLLAVEGGEAVGLLGPVGAQDQVEEGGFLFFQLLLLLSSRRLGLTPM